jgi:tryptophanyl-tRNA synthetase
MWILSTTASMGYLSRMTQWKVGGETSPLTPSTALSLTVSKSKLSLPDNASPLEGGSKSKLKLGLFSYPVLQAADILVHRYRVT